MSKPCLGMLLCPAGAAAITAVTSTDVGDVLQLS
jgi:hypothetical protein